uniref:Cytochrome b n=1 Tax=Heterakis beramporia TaxID=596434 RepID=A0A142I172_9BILA|nr:cytochrome b [Heterakis beramporia]AMR36303.1 cytochrome b [Heterakis beramporia]
MFRNLGLFMKQFILSLPASKALTLNWNFGSMLGMVLVVQLLTGLYMSCYYSNDSELAFNSVQYIMYEVKMGWLARSVHFNNANFFFIFMFLHFFKGLFFQSYRLGGVWVVGMLMFVLTMLAAFTGYVLVWAQMSFWAGVVITSLLSVIPIWGHQIVSWVWGAYIMAGTTLKFFFVIHFLIPWVILVLVVVHLLLLHETGSTSVIYCHSGTEKEFFGPYYWFKDMLNVFLWLMFFMFVFLYPFSLSDPEMFIEANPMTSPVHIVPEWYFLFAYAILRAIPNKILGVVALIMSVGIWFVFVFFHNFVSPMVRFHKFLVSVFLFNGIVLSWLWHCMVQDPFVFGSMFCTFMYFFLVFSIGFNSWFWKFFYISIKMPVF